MIVLGRPQSMAKAQKIEAFGQELRKRREAKGMDQKVLAARAGISPQHLNQMEKAYSRPGRPPVGPGDDVIESISEALGWRVIDIRRTLGQIPDDETEYIPNPDESLLLERYTNAPERDRKIVDTLLGLGEEAASDAESAALRASRAGSIGGKRAD